MKMRARIIQPEFFADEDLAELEPTCKLLFIGLWLLADREGRLPYKSRSIRGELFRYLDSVTCNDIERHVMTLASGGPSGHPFIHVYEVENKAFIQILNFKKHQHIHPHERRSEIPAPSYTSIQGGYMYGSSTYTYTSTYTSNSPATGAESNPAAPLDGCDLSAIAARIFNRHRAGRKTTRVECERALAMKCAGAVDPMSIAEGVDRRHAAWCDSEDWRKDGGKYVPGLDKWLSGPRCDSEPPAKTNGVSNLPTYDDLHARGLV